MKSSLPDASPIPYLCPEAWSRVPEHLRAALRRQTDGVLTSPYDRHAESLCHLAALALGGDHAGADYIVTVLGASGVIVTTGEASACVCGQGRYAVVHRREGQAVCVACGKVRALGGE